MPSSVPAAANATAASRDSEWAGPEGLYHEGPNAPADGRSRESDWIEIPHEHFIPVSKARLVRALESLPAARDSGGAVPALLRQIDTAYHLTFQRTLNVLKEDYEYFAPDVGESIRQGVSEDELRERQRRFLATFLETMARGNFAPLTEPEYTRAVAQSYLFDLPVEIQWSALDDRMLRDLYGWLDEAPDRKSVV